MATEPRGRRVAILIDGVEQVELEQSRQSLVQTGARVTLLSIHDPEIPSRNSAPDKGDTPAADALVEDVATDDFDALVLAGGTVRPEVVRFVRAFVGPGKSVGSIRHGPWM
jgi:protease I